MNSTYPWLGTKPYNDYSSYIKRLFGRRIQKISLNAGFSCPNRDGTKGHTGCIYCNNRAFNPHYCTPDKSVIQQLDEGIALFSKKYKTQKYLAYFQAYTNTYSAIKRLMQLYHQALSHPGVIGLVIATRPDCVNDEVLDAIKKLTEKYYVAIEYGVESTLNKTLKRINRHHTFEDSIKAIESTARRKIPVGVHLILGLPDETHDDMIKHAENISLLPVNMLKVHQLQIVRNTILADEYQSDKNSVQVFDVDHYIDTIICFLEHLHPKIIVERFISEAPLNLLIAPRWYLKNFEIVHKIEKRMHEKNTRQGKYFD